jgi:hypothetical protein
LLAAPQYGTVRPKTQSRAQGQCLPNTASKYTPSLAAIGDGSHSRSGSPLIAAHRPHPHPVTALTQGGPAYLPPPSTAKGANTAAGE